MQFKEKPYIPDIENLTSKEKIEKVERLPYIHIEKHPELEDRYNSFFAIKVDSIINKSLLDDSKYSNPLYEQLKFIQCMLTGSSDQSIELRYIASPGEENWTKGKIDIVLILKNQSKSYDNAYLNAVGLWKNISSNLNVEACNYELSPVFSCEEFSSKWLPFGINDIAEIVKREEAIPLNRNKHLYIPCPFIPTTSAFSRLCKGLLAHRMPLIYSVTLQPAVLNLNERNYIENPLSKNGSEIGYLPPKESRRDMGELIKKTCLAAKSTYLMKIHVAGSRKIPSSILDIIGSEITLPPAEADVNIDRQKTQLYRGGYAWYKPGERREFETAVNNLMHHEFKSWIPALAPEEVKRLRYIVDISQAGSAFRLPFPIDEDMPPGLKIRNFLPIMTANFSKKGVLLGRNRFGDAVTEIRINPDERRKHCYIQGATGTGKTTLIINMALQDINEGRGVIALDYTGDLSLELLKRMPEHRIKDVIYFNAADIEYPVGFNPLSYDVKSPLKDLLKENIIDSILSWLKKEYEKDAMGPAFFQNLRNALILIMADDKEPATIMDFVSLFYDDNLIKKMLEKLQNPLVKKFWEESYNSENYKRAGDNGLSFLQYITCKFSPMVDMELTRNIFCQRESKLNFREIIDNRQILICNLAKGAIGDFNAKFLGLMLISKIEQAALSRTDVPEEQRVDSYLYLDECQNLQTEHFYNMLSEMRKYRVNICLANQHFSQLDNRMRDAIIANCGTMIIFKTGIKDAEILEPMLYPYNKKLVVRLSNYHAAVRAVNDGDVKTFTMETLPVQFNADPEMAKKIIHMSRQKYGKRRLLENGPNQEDGEYRLKYLGKPYRSRELLA